MGFRLYIGDDQCPTLVDVMIYNEVSQVLFMYNYFLTKSKSMIVSTMSSQKPDRHDTDELIGY